MYYGVRYRPERGIEPVFHGYLANCRSVGLELSDIITTPQLLHGAYSSDVFLETLCGSLCSCIRNKKNLTLGSRSEPSNRRQTRKFGWTARSVCFHSWYIRMVSKKVYLQQFTCFRSICHARSYRHRRGNLKYWFSSIFGIFDNELRLKQQRTLEIKLVFDI